MELQILMEEILRKRGVKRFVAHSEGPELRFTLNYPPFDVDVVMRQSSRCLTVSAYLRLVGLGNASQLGFGKNAEKASTQLDDFSLRAELPLDSNLTNERAVERLLSVLLDLCKQYADAIRTSLYNKGGRSE